MASEQDAMDVAMEFYEHKDVEKFMAECKAKNSTVHIAEEKHNEFVD